MNIIVCDDSPFDREMLTGLLRKYGAEKNLPFEIAEYDCGETLCEDDEALKQAKILFLTSIWQKWMD